MLTPDQLFYIIAGLFVIILCLLMIIMLGGIDLPKPKDNDRKK